MKANFAHFLPNIEGNEIVSVNIYEPEFSFDSEWFINTTPSINNTADFVPEWEDATDPETVMLFFIAEFRKILLPANSDILCEEAKEALRKYNDLFNP